MKDGHLTDEVIQEYVWEPQKIGSDVQLHMSSCERCKSVAANYQLLFQQVAEINAPAFDFDLAGSVLSQLSAISMAAPANTKAGETSLVNEQETLSRKNKIGWPLIVVSFLAVSLIGTSLYFLRDYFGNVTGGVSVMITYLITMTIVLIMGFLVFEEFRKYSKQVNSLNM